MRIGIDAHILGKGKGGVERYVHHLADLLPRVAPENEYVLYVSRAYARESAGTPLPPNVRLDRLLCSDPLIQRPLLLPLLARRDKLDVLHVQRIGPPAPGCALAVTIHDVLPLTLPAEYPGLRNDMVRFLTPRSARRANCVFTVSETVRRELMSLFGLPPEKVVTVYNGLDHEMFRLAADLAAESALLRRLELNGPYVLYLGALDPRKNILLLLEACKKRLASPGPKFTLVLAGMLRDARYGRAVTERVRALGLESDVRFTGRIHDAECVELLQRAHLFVAPSLGEGFDFPPLEAMACGVPVICSDIEVHREVLAGSAHFFDPASADALADALGVLWDDPARRAGLRTAGLERVKEFSWEKTACQIAKQYHALASVR